VFKAATTWWRSRGWITANPVAGIERRPAPPDRTRALARRQIDDLYEVKAGLREKTLWRLLFESAARAGEVLSLNIEDLVLPGKRAKVISKGGATEWIHWQSPTAQLLPRLITGRKRGPLFLTERLAPSWTPALDMCPATRRARLSYRRAAEMFEEATRALANPGITGEAELVLRGGWTFHQLRHAALTLEAEDGTNTPTLLAISRHASVRSLERYTRVGVDAVARHVAQRDPAARRRTGGQPR
jgi:integrase/recombinase XerD